MTNFCVDFRLAPCSQTERLAVRHSAQTLFDGKHGTMLYRESYAPECWLAPAKPVPFNLGHDGDTVGHVVVIASQGAWHHGSAVIEDGPLQPLARQLIKVGSRVSLAARSIRRDDDADLRVVRHRLCRLDEVALVREGEVAGFLEAKVTRVFEPATRPSRPSKSATSLAYKETNGQEFLVEAPTAADHAHVAWLRKTGCLLWAR